MTQNGFRSLQLNVPGLGCWVTILLGAWLLGAVGLGWLVKSALVLVGLMVLLPIVAIAGVRFWLRRNLVTGNCPVCGQGLNGLAPLQTPCPSCGTLLKATRQGFERVTPDGTVEVQAIEVDVSAAGSTLEAARYDASRPDGGATLDVEAQALPESD
ncbi:MAG: hypothetical protein AAFQ61_00260 [Cyanobacteria bacterium J06626_23]